MVKVTPPSRHRPGHHHHRHHDHGHHHHRHHDHGHHHHHHHHSGSTELDEQPVIGSAQHGMTTALAALRAMNSKEARHYALGNVIANLIQSGHINGLGDVVKQTIAQTNRYDYVDH